MARQPEMNVIGKNANRMRAERLPQRSAMAKDEKLKKFWDDLADEWLALNDNKLPDKGPSEKPSDEN
jgi:hypothetical protein